MTIVALSLLQWTKKTVKLLPAFLFSRVKVTRAFGSGRKNVIISLLKKFNNLLLVRGFQMIPNLLQLKCEFYLAIALGSQKLMQKSKMFNNFLKVGSAVRMERG